MIKHFIIDVQAKTEIETELIGAELEQYLKDKTQSDEKVSELLNSNIEVFESKILILEKLGLTKEEAKALLG